MPCIIVMRIKECRQSILAQWREHTVGLHKCHINHLLIIILTISTLGTICSEWLALWAPHLSVWPLDQKKKKKTSSLRYLLVVKSTGSGATVWVGIQALQLSSCVFLSKSFKQSVLVSSSINWRHQFIGLLWTKWDGTLRIVSGKVIIQ